ncbi:rhodanese-like domain-containing protein [Clostridium ihumii]|uniref:rhodanese-like domain-containing protein n=1 Tax=Clostridium ihumii TaxID=1470356 RepID=UPI003D337E57
MNKTLKLMITALTLTVSMGVFTACGNNSGVKENEEKNVSTKTITTEELSKNIKDENWVVVDTRENDAFNGWKLDGVKRGGHIEGATDFSASWLDVNAENKEERLQKDLKDRGISKDKNIVLYDANGKDASEVANYLSEKGYENLYTYDVKEWTEDDKNAMKSYENYEMLVPVSWVKDLIDGNKPEGYSGKEFKIFEVSWGEEKDSPDYLKKGHIKGAIHINTDEVEEGPVWNRLSDEKLKAFAKANGITVDTTVVLYGEDTTPAARVATILKYLGVKDVRLINGGTQKWIDAGYELEKESNPKQSVSDFGAEVPVNKDYIIDLDEVKKIYNDKATTTLVDVRNWDEYIGKISGYDYIKTTGRIEGALWGHAGTKAGMDQYRNIDNTMLNEDQILKMWKDYGITPDKKLVFYCGTGWRAAEALYYADVMGIKDITLYDGGWNEWSGNTGNPANPIEKGEPKK